MRVLVLGASGFIGGHVASAFLRSDWTVRAGARNPSAAGRRLTGPEWVAADFGRLKQASDWTALLAGVDAVVNCVGVLQDGVGNSLVDSHVAGPAALFAACEASRVRRIVLVSAVGADEAAHTAYAATKAQTETLLRASGLDWVIVRPSLVMARDFFGGTGLMRGLAGFPGVIPAVGGDQVFCPVDADDLAAAIVRLAAPAAPAQVTLDIAGPQAVTLADLLKGLRRWLGFRPARVIRIPRVLARPVLLIGDALGWLGWPSPLRTTALRQMDHFVAGDHQAWAVTTGVAPLGFDELLARQPSSLADRWHARLYFVRPLAILLLGVFWLATGFISLGPGRYKAICLLEGAHLGQQASVLVVMAGALADIGLGLALWVRPWTRTAALLMVGTTLIYLAAATVSLPQLWIDPLGPWMKIVPLIALCLFVAATDDTR